MKHRRHWSSCPRIKKCCWIRKYIPWHIPWKTKWWMRAKYCGWGFVRHHSLRKVRTWFAYDKFDIQYWILRQTGINDMTRTNKRYIKFNDSFIYLKVAHAVLITTVGPLVNNKYLFFMSLQISWMKYLFLYLFLGKPISKNYMLQCSNLTFELLLWSNQKIKHDPPGFVSIPQTTKL